jgi:hypothetical protein
MKTYKRTAKTTGMSIMVATMMSTSVISGCATVEGQGLGLGALAGLGTGLLACGGKSGSAKTKCIALITAAGAAIGYAAGSYVKSKKGNYESSEAFYADEITLAADDNIQLTQYAQQLQGDISELEVQLAAIERREAQDIDMSVAKASTLSDLNRLEAENAEKLATLNTIESNRKDVLASINHELKTSRDIDKARVAEQKSTYTAQIDELTMVRNELAASGELLASVKSSITT